MKETIIALKQIIIIYSEKLKQLSETDFSEKPNQEVWSKKEELGHLIDSAHNNLRRFIVAQYEEQPMVVYDQNLWNKAANYQYQSTSELITLWMLLNNQICQVLENMPAALINKSCNTGIEKIELHPINWLAEDYNKHLLHHLHHLLDLKPLPY